MNKGSLGPAIADNDKDAKTAMNTNLSDLNNIYFSKK
jgi:hypothetical protein